MSMRQAWSAEHSKECLQMQVESSRALKRAQQALPVSSGSRLSGPVAVKGLEDRPGAHIDLQLRPFAQILQTITKKSGQGRR